MNFLIIFVYFFVFFYVFLVLFIVIQIRANSHDLNIVFTKPTNNRLIQMCYTSIVYEREQSSSIPHQN